MVIVLGGVGNLLGVPTGRLPDRRRRDAFSPTTSTRVIGQLLVFVAIVIAIRVFPRGIFGYHERTHDAMAARSEVEQTTASAPAEIRAAARR